MQLVSRMHAVLRAKQPNGLHSGAGLKDAVIRCSHSYEIKFYSLKIIAGMTFPSEIRTDSTRIPEPGHSLALIQALGLSTKLHFYSNPLSCFSPRQNNSGHVLTSSTMDAVRNNSASGTERFKPLIQRGRFKGSSNCDSAGSKHE